MNIEKFHKELIEELDNLINIFIHTLKEKNKKIVIWGTGKFGRVVYNSLKTVSEIPEIIGFGDNNIANNKKKLYNLTINNVDAYVNHPEILFVICSKWENDIRKQFDKLNLEYTVDAWAFLFKDMLIEYYQNYGRDVFPHSNNFYYFCNKASLLYIKNDVKEQLKSVMELTAENKYISIYQKRLDLILKGELSLARDYYSKELEYFDKNFYNSKHITNAETYVDCGGYIGDTVEDFINMVGNNNYRKIYVYEPDPDIYQKLTQCVTAHHFKNVILKQCAVGNKKIDNYSEFPTVKLDDDIDEEVTWIKMDIEGFELAALQGAKEIITKYHPKLAICLYHCVEDIYKIPLYIHELVPEYRFKFGQHFRGHWDFVLYADIY